MTGYGNQSRPTTAQRIAEMIPGTSEHAATHPTRGTGLDGLGQAIKEHIPGTNQMEAGGAGYGNSAGAYRNTGTIGTTHTGTSTADRSVEQVPGTARTGYSTGMGTTGAGADWADDNTAGRTGFAGTPTGGMTDNMTAGEKVKAMMPGTTEHALKREEQDRML
ncbi:hypothetical protein WJX72_007211 [[Myrmecia] bisecta]|uniref:Dehydrin n=1 Tax=[Myrmecia] bisecta TaxID=41462 RepID=A0AAW1PXZ4_9CHLO